MSAVPESEQVYGFWREQCAAVLSWPEVAAMPGHVRRYHRNPLRCVVSREIIRVRTSWDSTHLLYHEVLSCGHPLTTSPLLEADYIAHRRRCAACGECEASRPAHAFGQLRGTYRTPDTTRRPGVALRPRRLVA